MTSSTEKQRLLIPVIISGGSGTRLWPLSRQSRPKQFLPLLGDKSLFQETLFRAQRLEADPQSPIVVCNAAHRDLVVAQAREIGVEPQAVVLEPVGRNTAPAVAIAAILASQVAVDPQLLVLPADHVVLDPSAFSAAVRVAIRAAEQGRLVTFGVVPDRPETGYGYIQRANERGGWAEIRRFVEKPDLPTAESSLASGEYSWNSGMFLFPTAKLLAEFRAHAPQMLDACEQIASALGTARGILTLGAEFAQCPADSIDYAIMEKTGHGAVVPLVAGWNDVGSWTALHDVAARDSSGNAISGDVLLEDAKNSYVIAKSRLVALVGVDDVIVVETADAVIVLKRERAQDVKKIVDTLKTQKRAEV